MIKMMVTVVFVFTLCWLPFNIIWVVQEEIPNFMKPYLWFSSHWLAMSHACYNPIIYCYMNSRFRTGFLQALSTIPCCRECFPSIIMVRPRSSTGFALTSIEGTESTLLHRNNTSTTYISMRRKNGNRTPTCNQFPVRSVSVMRSNNNNQHSHQLMRRVRHSSNIVEDEI